MPRFKVNFEITEHFRIASKLMLTNQISVILKLRWTKNNNLGISYLQLSWKSDKFPVFHMAHKRLRIINISLKEYSKTDISIDLLGIILDWSDGMSDSQKIFFPKLLSGRRLPIKYFWPWNWGQVWNKLDVRKGDFKDRPLLPLWTVHFQPDSSKVSMMIHRYHGSRRRLCPQNKFWVVIFDAK